MQRPLFKPVGTPATQLDTPALAVDLTVLEQNIATFQGFFQHRPAKVRPYVTAHRCPVIAHKQLAAGGTVGGICVTTVGEAEVFAEHGFRDIFVANKVVTPPKMRRLCALAQHTIMTVAVDHSANVVAWSEAATAHGVMLRVVVDIQTQPYRSGVAPGQPAVALARAVHAASHLDFVGLTTSAGPLLTASPDAWAALSRQGIQQVLDTRETIERAGLEVRVVSVGSTADFETAGSMPGVTEVPAGVYALMDARHQFLRSPLTPAARVLTTVTSRPEPDTVITDAGQKAVSVDRGLPTAAGIPEATVVSLSAEHCRLRVEGMAAQRLPLGAPLWLTPQDIGTCVNLYDYIHAIRDGRLETVWRVAARGQYR